MRDQDQKGPRVYHYGAALQGIADEHADVLTPRQRKALYEAAALLWDRTPAPTNTGLGDLDLDGLEKVARAAPQWEWSNEDSEIWSDEPYRLLAETVPLDGDPRAKEGFGAQELAIAEHIATFDPPTVIKLIAAARSPQPAAPEGRMREAVARIIGANVEPSAAWCDCEAPEPAEGVALVSEDCPIHGGRPERWS